MSNEPANSVPAFNIREVYKAGWVKRTSFADKKSGPFGKRYDRLWALFCIHDDVYPFLEFYSDPKASSTHQPISAASLVHCLHISPSIVVQGDTYEFVITLTSAAIRLGTGTREQMAEWVDVLRNRLRDIGVLDPKENLYSALPESRSTLVPSSTRDPNSPLPLPPPPPSSNSQIASESPANDLIAIDSEDSDDFYAATETQLVPAAPEPAATPLILLEDEEDEAATRLTVSDHVTVISVNNDGIDDPFEEAVDRAPNVNAFSTRVRIASAPSSLLETAGHCEENSYEAIFTAPTSSPRTPVFRTRTIDSFNPAPAAEAPSAVPSARSDPSHAVPVQAENEVVLRSSAAHARRDALRRTVSVGSELPSPGSHAAPSNPRPLALVMSVNGSRDRRREGLMMNPILLPRNVPPPPMFVAPPPPPPPPPLVPLPARMGSSPLHYRPPPLSSALQPVTSNQPNGTPEMGYSLKERQVARLRMEMQHPAGVRIVLKKRDCLNTIALVDALGAVWVAGWRQKEKPLLYNVFHIGDQVVRVGHCSVSSAADVHRLIKNDTGPQVEFIVRRMPFGRVFNLRRESEGQSVGIVTEGNTAEVREVVAGGLAAQQGVPFLAISPLSPVSPSSPPSPCTWTLTEINGRPLNLCSKEGEARDRLLAVGKAISINIQPTDFVKVLKKQLKSLRGYKDFLLG